MKYQTNKITIAAVGQGFDKSLVRLSFPKKQRYTRYNNVVHVELAEGELWMLDYGVIIGWGLDSATYSEWVAKLVQTAVDQPFENVEEEKYTFTASETANRLVNDVVELCDNDVHHRLAVILALAQSIKLNVYENLAQRCITNTFNVPRSLAKTGKTGLSRKDIACQRGMLFSVKSDIVLNYGLLDTPDFFWHNPELQPFYSQLAQYLEIRLRVDLLAKKVETIHELFEMLADEQKHRHSSMLEWLIIALIAVDIVLATLPGVLHSP